MPMTNKVAPSVERCDPSTSSNASDDPTRAFAAGVNFAGAHASKAGGAASSLNGQSGPGGPNCHLGVSASTSVPTFQSAETLQKLVDELQYRGLGARGITPMVKKIHIIGAIPAATATMTELSNLSVVAALLLGLSFSAFLSPPDGGEPVVQEVLVILSILSSVLSVVTVLLAINMYNVLGVVIDNAHDVGTLLTRHEGVVDLVNGSFMGGTCTFLVMAAVYAWCVYSQRESVVVTCVVAAGLGVICWHVLTMRGTVEGLMRGRQDAVWVSLDAQASAQMAEENRAMEALAVDIKAQSVAIEGRSVEIEEHARRSERRRQELAEALAM